MTMFRELWQKDRILIFCVVLFSMVYITIGYLWFLAPQEKYYIGGAGTKVEAVAPVLGWAIPFLNRPPYILVLGLAIAGGFAGWLTWRLFSLKWPGKLLGASLWLVLALINYYVGLFLYAFGIMRW